MRPRAIRRVSATSSTSHQLRDGLKKMGWSIEDSDTEVRLMVPNKENLSHVVEDVLGTVNSVIKTTGSGEAAFQLEYQLRGFLARNLHVVSVNKQRLSLYS